MLEIPESYTLAKQLSRMVAGKTIASAMANQSPHKFAWFEGDPAAYDGLLSGKTMGESVAWGGLVEMAAGDYRIVLSDGAYPHYCANLAELPKKHQLLLTFSDETALAVTVQMYGGIFVSPAGELENGYYVGSVKKPSPLGDDFTWDYFRELRAGCEDKLSAKAFLATEQRIPGLGNGVLQDILYLSGIHPKRKMGAVSEDELRLMYDKVVSVLREMVEKSGRDTEKDLFGEYGGYRTLLSKNTVGTACPRCGGTIEKASYLGGSIYYCEGCQK